MTVLPHTQVKNILEALIRDYFLNLIKDNCDMLFCQNEINDDYHVYFRCNP